MASNQKNLIDKELMYQKIMPSSLRQTAGQSNDESNTVTTRESMSHTSLERQKLAPKEFNKQEIGIALPNKQQSVLINIIEKVVLQKIEPAFQKFNCCKCDHCKKDVAAIALNYLDTKYVVTTTLSIPLLEQKQDTSQITAAIVKAILTVRDNPRH